MVNLLNNCTKAFNKSCFIPAKVEASELETEIEDDPILSDEFEGDIELSDDQREIIENDRLRNTVVPSKRWKNKTIPYKISKRHTAIQKALIRQAMDKIEKASCLKFVKRTSEKDYIKFTVS